MTINIDPHCDSLVAKTSLPQELGFGKFFAPLMVTAQYRDQKWQNLTLGPYAPLALDPATMVFHYGQSIFEGLKAYRNRSSLHLFRLMDHARRFNLSAKRMAMPVLPEEMFAEGAVAFCRAVAPLVPSDDVSNLYLRPFMFADQVGLGVRPSESYLFLIIGTPSGKYFADEAVKVMIERSYSRAASGGGTGAVKTGGNYAASLLSDRRAKTAGFHQTLWLDSSTRKNVEELTGMNIFFVRNNSLVTPRLNNSILPGVTRDTIFVLAKELNIPVVEEVIPIDNILRDIKGKTCTECFVCGTAAGITPVALLGEPGLPPYTLAASPGPITQKLAKALHETQRGQRPSPAEWIVRA